MATFQIKDILNPKHTYLKDLLTDIKDNKDIVVVYKDKKYKDKIQYTSKLKGLMTHLTDENYIKSVLKTGTRLNDIFTGKEGIYTLSNIDKTPYSKSKQSGAGSTVTRLAESSVIVALAYKVHYNKELNLSDTENILKLKKVIDLGKGSTEKNIKEVIEFLNYNPDWYLAATVSTDTILNEVKLTKRHNFHRDSVFMNSIYDRFRENLKKINTLNIRIDGNKWNPSDIWISDKNRIPNENDLPSVQSLNAYLLKEFKETDIIGVSLKKVDKHAKIVTYNLGQQDISFYFKEIKKVQKPFSSGDMYIITENGSTIQIRQFNANSDVQAELKGKHANQGKIGFGNIYFLLKKLAKTDIKKYKELIKKDKLTLLKGIQKLYNSLGYNFSLKDLEEDLSKKKLMKKEMDFLAKKYQALEISSTIYKSKNRDTICTAMFAYASSLGLKGLFDASVYDKIF